MSRPPLDLVIFDEYHGSYTRRQVIDGVNYITFHYPTQDKRLTDAELMAEFHCARADHIEASNHPSGTYWTPLGIDEDATADTAMERSLTYLRFASLPHYDEVAA